MDAKICARRMCPSFSSVHCRMLDKCRRPPTVVAVLTRPVDDITDGEQRKMSVYKDNWFDLLAINHLSRNFQAASGLENNKGGYESLVDAAFATSQKFDPIEQRQIATKALGAAFPRPILSLIKTLLPQSKFAREYFAAFTTLFFAWLVGPCEVKESELNGRREKNVVHIKKCRFLEETNCVGLCTNMCKMPSQSFIKDNLGMSVNMVPIDKKIVGNSIIISRRALECVTWDFEDMSCEMVFGQDPPKLDDDPAFKQPCYKQCKGNRKHSMKCAS